MDPDPRLLRDRRSARQAARRLHDARLQRRAHVALAGPRARRARRSIALPEPASARSSTGPTYAVAMLLFNLAGFLVLYVLQRLQGVLPLQSGRHGGGRARARLQHRRQLRHQHQLAELRRRKHDVLPRPDGRPDGAELRLGRDRHRHRGRADPRLRPRIGQVDRQFLGRYDPLPRSTSCCRSASC